MNNNVDEDGFILEQEGVDDEENNNNIIVSLQIPATKAANTSTSSNTSENSEPLFEDSGNDSNAEAKNKDKKRKGGNCVPKLIGNKKKNMKRQLSASQRAQLLLNKSKENAQCKKDLAAVMQKYLMKFSKNQGTSFQMR